MGRYTNGYNLFAAAARGLMKSTYTDDIARAWEKAPSSVKHKFCELALAARIGSSASSVVRERKKTALTKYSLLMKYLCADEDILASFTLQEIGKFASTTLPFVGSVGGETAKKIERFRRCTVEEIEAKPVWHQDVGSKRAWRYSLTAELLDNPKTNDLPLGLVLFIRHVAYLNSTLSDPRGDNIDDRLVEECRLRWALAPQLNFASITRSEFEKHAFAAIAEYPVLQLLLWNKDRWYSLVDRLICMHIGADYHRSNGPRSPPSFMQRYYKRVLIAQRDASAETSHLQVLKDVLTRVAAEMRATPRKEPTVFKSHRLHSLVEATRQPVVHPRQYRIDPQEMSQVDLMSALARFHARHPSSSAMTTFSKTVLVTGRHRAKESQARINRAYFREFDRWKMKPKKVRRKGPYYLPVIKPEREGLFAE